MNQYPNNIITNNSNSIDANKNNRDGAPAPSGKLDPYGGRVYYNKYQNSGSGRLEFIDQIKRNIKLK